MTDNSELAAAISARSGISEADVLLMLTAKADVESGVALQTVQRDPSNGTVAVRATNHGVPGWWVVTQDGEPPTHHLTPDKQWPPLYTPEEDA